MKSMLRMISAILLALLLVSALVGCGGDGTAPDETEAPKDMQTEPVVDESLHGLLRSSDRIEAATEIIAYIPYPDEECTAEQGGYTDGTCHYQFFIKKDEASGEKNNIVRLVKYDMEKQETVAVSDRLFLNHANDLTYNPKTGMLVAVHCAYDGRILSMISPETLEVTGTVTLERGVHSITYNESRDQYVVGLNGGQNFQILDANFAAISAVHQGSSITRTYTTQGISSDDAYIYFSYYEENVITVFDWDGNFVSLIYLDIMGEEPENVSVVGDEIYVITTADGGAAVRRLALKKFEGSPLRDRESRPTPAADSGAYLTDYISADRVRTYLPLDGGEADAMGQTKTSAHKWVDYLPGVYGEAASVAEGYISIHDYAPANASFTVSLWLLTKRVSGDPAIFSNMDWDSSKNPGYILALKHNCLQFSMGSEARSASMKAYYPLPYDFNSGWMHILLSVDRAAGTVSVAFDFGEFITVEIPAALKDVSLDAFDVLNLGQDGTGKYSDTLPAALDEVIIFDGAFTEADVSALAGYYGIE